MMFRLRACLSTILLGYLLVTIASFGLSWLGIVQSGWPVLIREMGPLLAVPVLAVWPAALLVKARGAMTIGLGWPIACGLFIGQPLLLPAATPTQEPALRVFFLNTGAARGIRTPDATIAAIRGADPDLICLVESSPGSIATIVAELAPSHPHSARGDDQLILSRYPLSDPQGGILTEGAKGSLEASVEVDHRLIAVTAVHLRRADSYPGLQKGALPLLRAAWQFSTVERDATVRELVDHLRATGGSRILVGDFNMTPTSAAYGIVSSELDDAFMSAGRGFGHTYPAALRSFGLGLPIPLIRIDYVFHSTDFVAQRAWVGPAASSDHLPVIVELKFR